MSSGRRIRLPQDLAFRGKGQLAVDLRADAYADGLVFDFICGDEVYGNCTELRRFLEDHEQVTGGAHVFDLAQYSSPLGLLMRAPSNQTERMRHQQSKTVDGWMSTLSRRRTSIFPPR